MAKFNAIVPDIVRQSRNLYLPFLQAHNQTSRNASLYFGGFPKPKHKKPDRPSTPLYPKLSTKELNRQKKSTLTVRPRTPASALPLRRRVIGVAPRYAKSLYASATKSMELKRIYNDLLKVRSKLNTETRPQSSRRASIEEEDDGITEEDIEDLGTRLHLSWTTIDFLKKLVRQGKLTLLDQIITSYSSMMANREKTIVCEVTTSAPLDGIALKYVKDKIRASLNTKKNIKIRNMVDRSHGGGVTIKLGDCMFDMGVAKMLQKYEMLLKKVTFKE